MTGRQATMTRSAADRNQLPQTRRPRITLQYPHMDLQLSIRAFGM